MITRYRLVHSGLIAKLVEDEEGPIVRHADVCEAVELANDAIDRAEYWKMKYEKLKEKRQRRANE